jgi:hypothetical protein
MNNEAASRCFCSLRFKFIEMCVVRCYRLRRFFPVSFFRYTPFKSSSFRFSFLSRNGSVLQLNFQKSLLSIANVSTLPLNRTRRRAFDVQDCRYSFWASLAVFSSQNWVLESDVDAIVGGLKIHVKSKQAASRSTKLNDDKHFLSFTRREILESILINSKSLLRALFFYEKLN